MKKLLLLVVALAAAGVFALPGLAGWLAEARQREMVADLHAAPGAGQLVLEHYQRGWFRSRARYRYLVPAATSGRGIALTLDSELVHGPIPFTAWGRPGATSGILAAWACAKLTLDNGAEEYALPGELFLRVLPRGDIEIIYSLPAGAAHLGDRGHIAWLATQARVVFDPATRRAAFDGSSDGIEITGDEQAVALSDLSLIGAFASTNTRGQIDVDGRAARVQDGAWQGAGIVRFALSAIETRLLAAWLHEVLRSAAAAEPANDGSMLTPELQALIGAGGQLQIDELRLPGPDGALTATLAADVPVVPGGLPIPELINELDAQLHLAISQRLALRITRGNEQFRRAFLTMLQLHLVRTRDEEYLVDAEMSGGMLTVNGIPIPWLPGF